MSRNLLSLPLLALFIWFACGADHPLGAATFTVMNTSNNGAGSLRQAFLDAESNSEADTILFDAAVEGQTIQMLGTIVVNTGTVTLNGGTISNGVTLSGNHQNTIFRVESGAMLNLFQVNLTEGSDVAGPGAMFVLGEANLTRCAVFNNQGSTAGAIANFGGILNLTNCTLTNNGSSSSGGGITSTISSPNRTTT